MDTCLYVSRPHYRYRSQELCEVGHKVFCNVLQIHCSRHCLTCYSLIGQSAHGLHCWGMLFSHGFLLETHQLLSCPVICDITTDLSQLAHPAQTQLSLSQHTVKLSQCIAHRICTSRLAVWHHFLAGHPCIFTRPTYAQIYTNLCPFKDWRGFLCKRGMLENGHK